MYRILVVDDEGLELNGLRIILQKEFGDEISIETAASGRIAIEVFETFRPEIILMDIQMPGINGLDAIKEIRKDHSSGKFLMLTAYDNFEYVQKALSIGVSGYLTKPINRQQLVTEIRSLMAEIDKEKSQRREDLMLRERLDAAIPMLEAGFIYSILLHQDWMSVTSNYMRLLGVEKTHGYFIVADYNIDDNPDSSVELVGYSGKIKALYKELFRDCVSQQMGKRELTAVLVNEPQDEYAARLQIINRVSELQERLEKILGISIEIGIGSIMPICQLADSYTQAVAAIGEKSGSVAHFSDLPIGKHWEEGYPQDEEYAIYDAAEAGDAELALKYAEGFFGWMEYYHSDDFSDVKLKALELVLRVDYLMFHTGGRTYHFMDRHGYLETLNGMNSMDELKSWFLSKLSESMMKNIEEKEEASVSSMEQARLYIEQHYMENITLNDISEMVYISPYYFSKLFKEKTGRNFIEYLTGTRMEHAKRLLETTEQSVKEICVSVGYSDPNYFSRSFKKYEGMTPGEYRERKA